MATPWAIGDGVVEGAPGAAADATVGEEARYDAVASSPTCSLPPLARALPEAAGGQARRAQIMAAASSSSSSLPAAAGSEPYETPATPWVILWRILRQDALTGAEAEAETQAQAQHAAPDLALPLALPPRVTVISAGPGAHPYPNHPDEVPFLVSAATLGLLIEFTAPGPFNGAHSGVNTSPYVSHLMLARHFHTADGQTTATLERVIDRTGQVPVLKTLESVVFCSNEMGEYLIAELQVDDEYGDFASLIYLESGKEEWSFRTMECPLMSEWRKENKVEDRKWLAHGSASDDRMFWWFDLSWGIVSYDASVSISEADELLFHELPDHRALHEATRDIQTKRCITLSRNKLRYVEIEESGTLIMWTWSCIPSGWHWIKRYEMRFEELWNADTYKRTRLPRNVPLLCVVCPSNPDLVYLALGQKLFGVNVPDLRVEHGEAYQLANVPGPPRPPSARYIVPWDLPSGIKSEHCTITAKDETILPITQKEDTVLAVWRDNWSYAFGEIEKLMRIKGRNWVIGIDSEFCAQELRPLRWTNPSFGDESYTHMRQSVDEGNLVQVGFAIVGLDCPEQTHVFEFNIQFDPTNRPDNSTTVAFLRKMIPQLEKHAIRGISVDDFMDKLSSCGVLNNTAVTWVSYQGFADYGYLIRGLKGVQRMPDNRTDFLKSVEILFPKNYDLKTFHEIGCYCDRSERGKANLEALAVSLGAERTGKAHTAGSDALLTVRCFSKLVAREVAFAPMMRLQGNLFRMAPIVLHNLPAIYDTNVSVVRVDCRNFQREAIGMQKLFPLFGIVSAELKFTSEEHIRTENYGTACQDLGRMTAAEVVIAISDPHGWPAHGKVWKFTLNNGDNSISSGMLADLLTRTGAISNPAVQWISSEVGLFLYLVDACTTASLPDKVQHFNTLSSGLFPSLFIVPAGTEEESKSDPASKVLATLRRFLGHGSNNTSNLELRTKLF